MMHTRFFTKSVAAWGLVGLLLVFGSGNTGYSVFETYVKVKRSAGRPADQTVRIQANVPVPGFYYLCVKNFGLNRLRIVVESSRGFRRIIDLHIGGYPRWDRSPCYGEGDCGSCGNCDIDCDGKDECKEGKYKVTLRPGGFDWQGRICLGWLDQGVYTLKFTPYGRPCHYAIVKFEWCLFPLYPPYDGRPSTIESPPDP